MRRARTRSALVAAVAALGGGLIAAAGPQAPTLPGLICTLSGHTDAVHAIAFSADGRAVVTGSFDRTVRVWDAESGQQQRQFGGSTGHQNYVLALSISPDGRQVASGSSDSTVRFWDLSESVAPQTIITEATVGLAASSSGGRMAAGARNGIHLWAGARGAATRRLADFAGAAVAVAFTDRGDVVVGAGEDRSLRFWDAASGAPQATYTGQAARARAIAAMPNATAGPALVTAGDDGVLRLWQLPTPIRSLVALDASIRAVAVSGDGRTLYGAAGRSVVVSPAAGGPAARRLDGPAATVQAVALSAGGTLLAAGTADGRLWAWNPATGQRLADVQAHEKGVAAVAVSPAAPQVLTAGADGRIKLWPTPVPGQSAALTPRTEFIAHPGGATAACFAGIATQAVSGGADGTVVVWDLAAKKEGRALGRLPAAVTALAFAKAGNLVAAAGGSEVRVWRLADGMGERSFRHPSAVTSVTFDSSGTVLITGAEDGFVRFWHAGGGWELEAVPGAGAARAVVASPNSAFVYCGGDDKQLSALRPSVQRSAAVSPQPLTTIAVTPDGNRVFVGGEDGSVRVVRANNATVERTLGAAAGPVRGLALTRDGRRAAVVDDRQVRMFDVADGKAVGSIAAKATSAIAFHPEGGLLAVAGEQAIAVWDVSGDSFRSVQTFAQRDCAALAFNRDGTALYAGGPDGVRLWRYRTGPPPALVHPNLVDAVAYRPDGSLLATGGHDGVLRLWDAAGQVVRQMKPELRPGDAAAPLYALAWDSAGRHVLTAGEDAAPKLWDADGGTLVREFRGHSTAVYSAAISPDGRHAAAGGADGSIRLWNIATGAAVREFVRPSQARAHPGPVYGLRFTRDSRRLLAAGAARPGYGFLAVWDVAGGQATFAAEFPTGPIYALALTSDGRRLALACGPARRGAPALAYVVATPGLP